MDGNNSTWRVPPKGCYKKVILLYFCNGSTDCVEIWYALGGPLVTPYRHGWGISARAHVQRYPPHRALLYLGNGLTDCVQIWYVGWGSLPKCLPQVIGEVHLHVRTCTPLFYKCSACRYYALGDPLVTAYAVVTSVVSLHVRMCTPRFCISGTARPIGFNFGV